MRRRQTKTPIHFACIRLRVMLPAFLGILGAFVPGLHSQSTWSAVLPSTDNQAGLNGTGILTSSGNAMNQTLGRVDQSITATYTGSLYAAASNASLASLKQKVIVSAQRTVVLDPGSARIVDAINNPANHAVAEYPVAEYAGAHRVAPDPMAELSQAIGPADGQGQHPGYMPAIDNQPVSAIAYAWNLEKIGGLQQGGGLEQIGCLEQGGLESFASGFGAPERLCGEGCGLTGTSIKATSVARDRRKQNTAAMQLKLEDRIQKPGELTTVSTELKTGSN